ncbi:MAG TPA: cyclic nucleotide-binding protein [Alphaproteobacteria bacterium]|nr:cyclic nucleotide-binding protein [Alphaproteobacteria bacterium]
MPWPSRLSRLQQSASLVAKASGTRLGKAVDLSGSALRKSAAAAAQGGKAMAFWSFGGGGTAGDLHVPRELETQLQRFPLTQDIGARAIRALVSEASWFSLPGGTILPRDGDNDSAVFLVISGALGVYANDDSEADRFVAHIPAGEMVGEMSMLSGESHSATLVALRDSQMLRLPKEAFERLMARHPRLSLNMMRILVRRLRNTTGRSAKTIKARSLAIIPLHNGAQSLDLAQRLSTALRNLSLSVEMIRPAESGQAPTVVEASHDIVLYASEHADGAWTQYCLRQADRVLLVAAEGMPIPSHPFIGMPEGRIKRQMPELVVMRASQGAPKYPELTHKIASAYSLHHYICPQSPGDVQRLARVLTGRSVGLVLAGGGARGFAHIGIIRALREAGVPFDLVAGASMGAIVGACVAMGWNDEEIYARMHEAFVKNKPLSDFTLPLVSVFRGQKVTRMLQENFGDLRIEELRLPFLCTSSDLSSGTTHVHRTGPVWRALRASVAIPGLLPPVVEEGRLLVDGGLMNNFPVDEIARLSRGPIVGIDVAGEENFSALEDDIEGRTWWRLWRDQMTRKGAPSIVSILMRSGTVGNEAIRRQARSMTDFLLDPPLPGIYLRSWKAFDQAVELGYAHAAEMIEQDGLNFLWAVKGTG